MIKRDTEILAEVDLDLEERRSQALRQVGGVQWAVAQSYERLQKRGEEILQQKGRSKTKGDAAGDKNQPPVDARLEESVQRQIELAMELMEGDILQLTWPQFQLLETVRKRLLLGPMLSAYPAELVHERDHLLEQIESTPSRKKIPGAFSQAGPPLLFEAHGGMAAGSRRK